MEDFDPPRVLSTEAVKWDRSDVLDQPATARERVSRAARILRFAREADVVVMNGSGGFHEMYDEIILAGALARANPSLCVVLFGCHWEAGSRVVDSLFRMPASIAHDRAAVHGAGLARGLIRWTNFPNVHYVVWGNDEAAVIAERWNIPRERIHAIMFHAHHWATAQSPERLTPNESREPRYVFAAGDSLRDYRPLLSVAPQLHAPLRIGSRLKFGAAVPNVEVRSYNQTEYQECAVGAAAHVVATIADIPRGTGQASYLDALMLGIPVVVTDGLTVREHLRDEIDALIVPPDDPIALGSAINRVLDDAALAHRLATNGLARAHAEFTLEAFHARLYEVIIDIRYHEHAEAE